jgi:ABC-type antimicrobial peptide transport system permease subunit
MGSMQGVALGSRLYPAFAPSEAITLAIFMFVVVSLVSIYPAWYASRLEPVKAMHAQ